MKVFSSETVCLHLFMHQYKIFFHLITSFSPLRCPDNLKITKVEGGGVKKMQPPQDNSWNSPWYGAKNYPLVWIHQDQISFKKRIFSPVQMNRVYVHSSKKKKKLTRMDFESKESKEMKYLSTSEK